MDRYSRTVEEWLAEEGQRRRRPYSLPLWVGDAAVRGIIHVVVCLFLGIVVIELFLCWVNVARTQTSRAAVVNELRVMGHKQLTE